MAQRVATGSGNWSTDSNWTPFGAPAAGEAISIASGVTLIVDGNYTVSGIQINNGASSAPATLVLGSGAQLTVNGYVSLGSVSNGGGGVLQLNDGTISANGFSVEASASGNSFNAGSGSVVLTGNNTLPALFSTFYNLTLDGSAGPLTTTASGPFAVSAALTTGVNTVLDMSSYQLVGAGSLINNGTLQTRNTSLTPFPAGLDWGNPNVHTGAVLYQAESGGQTIMAGTYNNLYVRHLSGGISKAAGSIDVGGEVATLSSGTILDMGTYQLSSTAAGGIGGQNNVGTIRTQFVGIPGDLAIPIGRTWGGTIVYNASAGGQKIVNGTYNNLEVDINGTNESSTIVVNGIFKTSPTTTIDMNQETINGFFNAAQHQGNLIVRGTLPFDAGKTFGGTVTYDGTVAQTVRTGTYQNLAITTFRSFDLTLEAGTIAVRGDLLFSSVLENGAMFQVAGSLFDFSGAAAQNIDVTARQINPNVVFAFNGISFSGGGLKTLLSPVYVNGNADFVAGVLATTGTNILVLNDGATVSGGNTSSYVQGPLRRIGTTAFTFPVGGSGVYAPLGISAPGANGDFTARYVRSNPQALGTTLVTPVAKVSACEYWNLVKNAGDNNPTVTLSWSAESGCNGPGQYISNLSTLLVVRYNGAAWESAGNGGTTGGIAAGTIESGAMTQYDNITLGSSSSDNLLPVRFIAVSAAPRNGAVDVRWTVAEEFNVAHYEVLRSTDGRSFNAVARQSVVAGRSDYAAVDAQPLSGAAFYRVRAVDADGRITLSPIVRVRTTGASAGLEVYPMPARGGSLQLRTEQLAAGSYELKVFDASGRVVLRESVQHAGGALSRTLVLPTGMAAGRYQLLLSGTDGYTGGMPLLVQ